VANQGQSRAIKVNQGQSREINEDQGRSHPLRGAKSRLSLKRGGGRLLGELLGLDAVGLDALEQRLLHLLVLTQLLVDRVEELLAVLDRRLGLQLLDQVAGESLDVERDLGRRRAERAHGDERQGKGRGRMSAARSKSVRQSAPECARVRQRAEGEG
jgi:hypothetical protein